MKMPPVETIVTVVVAVVVVVVAGNSVKPEVKMYVRRQFRDFTH